MAQHDFAPAWLSFPTPPSSTKTALNTEKHSEGLVRLDSRYNANRRRHNSSDAFDAALGRSNGGNFGRKEKNGWRSQGRTGSENINHSGTPNGTGSRSRSGTFHGGKGHGLRESVSENDATRKDDRERRKQFEAEDFPSLNPEHEKELNQNKSAVAGVWEYPLNSKSRPSRMLVIRKGIKDNFSLSGYPIATSSRTPALKIEMDAPKNLAPKEASPTQEQRSPQSEEHKLQDMDSSSSPLDLDTSNKSFRPNEGSPSDSLEVSQTSVDEVLPISISPTSNPDEDSSDLQNGSSSCHEQDINLNFDQGEIFQENENSFTSREMSQSSALPKERVLSISLEAEYRLLKLMGWREDDELYAPLTEDELMELEVISEQLRKNGFRKNGLLKNGHSVEHMLEPWKCSTFIPTYEDNKTETSSSDTSDDNY